ncbi:MULTISPECIES: hypothetical protein [unclassified Chelatococcus]|uniref:hypothetical protein n=1 Tax=unclassified Chelatococcus TaxID=2638111 RepID=UPI001BCA6C8A|nr:MULTISPECIES: hypothetical protein [unclassified Chelatococcus]MBS7696257.1 hypothetical protein [Chelatococcus sp. YT9]MBX3560085.1 hypothetical protein [Chelatococcus sp.]
MMGHREPLINGDEFDYLTRTRHCYNRPRNLPQIKRNFTKRIRRAAKVETLTEAEDAWRDPFDNGHFSYFDELRFVDEDDDDNIWPVH